MVSSGITKTIKYTKMHGIYICKKSIKLIVIKMLNKNVIKNVLKKVIKDIAKMFFF